MALVKINTGTVAAITYVTTPGYFKKAVGVDTGWLKIGSTDTLISPGRYLVVGYGPTSLTVYNASPWTREMDVRLPTVLEFEVPKRVYVPWEGIVSITRL